MTNKDTTRRFENTLDAIDRERARHEQAMRSLLGQLDKILLKARSHCDGTSYE